ncbi:cholinesterase 2-like [Diaphorina citri]|uniref:Carboxylic ester hydrolase n=1 Tax=Diaphorina citri TaxID=121845 RepID=A0A1S3CVG3_DIACI|nr:cholinesterase 2-like [Diaphorina citri]
MKWISLNYRNTPVVVFFEGEGFVSGTPSRFPAQDLAAEGLVVVSVNYRMNVFGFFSLEDAEARGNLGLLDQYLALLWVRENIPYFGGDGKSITLMGHSAGAASAVYHMVSPKTAGLFHKVIIMSGSATSPWMKTRSVSQASRSIARSLGCLTVNETRPILKCMRDKSTSELMRAFENQYKDGNWTELVLPVVDTFLPDIEQYLPRDPITALEEGMYHKVPVLTGITSHEGAISIARWSDLISQGFANLRQLFVNSIIPSVMNMYGFASHMSSVPEIRTLLEWQYVDNVPSGDAHALLSKILDVTLLILIKPYNLISPTSNHFLRHPAANSYGYGIPWKRYNHDLDNYVVIKSDPNLPPQQPILRQPSTSVVNDVAARYRISLWNELLPKMHNLSVILEQINMLNQIRTEMQLAEQPYRSVMFTLIGFVFLLLVLLVICVVLLKRKSEDRERDLF